MGSPLPRRSPDSKTVRSPHVSRSLSKVFSSGILRRTANHFHIYPRNSYTTPKPNTATTTTTITTAASAKSDERGMSFTSEADKENGSSFGAKVSEKKINRKTHLQEVTNAIKGHVNEADPPSKGNLDSSLHISADAKTRINPHVDVKPQDPIKDVPLPAGAGAAGAGAVVVHGGIGSCMLTASDVLGGWREAALHARLHRGATALGLLLAATFLAWRRKAHQTSLDRAVLSLTDPPSPLSSCSASSPLTAASSSPAPASSSPACCCTPRDNTRSSPFHPPHHARDSSSYVEEGSRLVWTPLRRLVFGIRQLSKEGCDRGIMSPAAGKAMLEQVQAVAQRLHDLESVLAGKLQQQSEAGWQNTQHLLANLQRENLLLVEENQKYYEQLLGASFKYGALVMRQEDLMKVMEDEKKDEETLPTAEMEEAGAEWSSRKSGEEMMGAVGSLSCWSNTGLAGEDEHCWDGWHVGRRVQRAVSAKADLHRASQNNLTTLTDSPSRDDLEFDDCCHTFDLPLEDTCLLNVDDYVAPRNDETDSDLELDGDVSESLFFISPASTLLRSYMQDDPVKNVLPRVV